MGSEDKKVILTLATNATPSDAPTPTPEDIKYPFISPGASVTTLPRGQYLPISPSPEEGKFINIEEVTFSNLVYSPDNKGKVYVFLVSNDDVVIEPEIPPEPWGERVPNFTPLPLPYEDEEFTVLDEEPEDPYEYGDFYPDITPPNEAPDSPVEEPSPDLSEPPTPETVTCPIFKVLISGMDISAEETKTAILPKELRISHGQQLYACLKTLPNEPDVPQCNCSVTYSILEPLQG